MTRRIRWRLGTGALLAALVATPECAWADQADFPSEVICQKGANIALVRFTKVWNDDAPRYRNLPRSVDGGLSASRPSKRDDCVMANGWTVRIRSGEKQAYAYGMGGADPPAFFSLWIDRRKVLSRKEWKPGYGDSTSPWTIAVVIRPDRLTYCRVSSDDAPDNGKISCRDEPLQLRKYPVDRVEYASRGTRPPVGTRWVMPGSPDPRICQQFLRLHRKDWPDSYAMIDSARIFGTASSPAMPPLAEAVVELAPGVRRKLISWSADNHYFDGDLIFIAPVTADAKVVLTPDLLDDSDHFPAAKLPAGWHLISGGLPSLYADVGWRYVHFDTQRLNGRLYLLAQPTNSERQPAAILVEPTPNGHRIVCRFTQVAPNF